MEEKELIQLLKQNKTKAQKWLFDNNSNWLHALCYRYVNNPTDAEDVLICGFQKIFEKIESFNYQGENSLYKWIKTVMINESLMFLRTKFTFVELTSIHEKIPSSEDNFSEKIDIEYITKKISELPIGYRTVFNLFVIDGFSHEEIAQRLKISINTSKSQLHKARNILKNRILNLENHDQ